MIYFHKRLDRAGVVYYATYGQDHLCAVEKTEARQHPDAPLAAAWRVTVPKKINAKTIIEETIHTVHGDMEEAFEWVHENNQSLHNRLSKMPKEPKRKKSDD